MAMAQFGPFAVCALYAPCPLYNNGNNGLPLLLELPSAILKQRTVYLVVQWQLKSVFKLSVFLFLPSLRKRRGSYKMITISVYHSVNSSFSLYKIFFRARWNAPLLTTPSTVGNSAGQYGRDCKIL